MFSDLFSDLISPTAAVHRGFSSKLRSPEGELTSPFNLPALGRRQTIYFLFRVCIALCFC